MRASEQLRSLNFDYDTDAELFTCLRPEIVAVVEAAERAPLRYGGYAYERSEALDHALAVLKRALSGV